MEKIAIIKIEVLPSGALAVYPSKTASSYNEVGRSGSGVSWDKNYKRFHILSSIAVICNRNRADKLSCIDWFKNILQATSDELGIDLVATDSTEWVNLSEDQKNQILHTSTNKV